MFKKEMEGRMKQSIQLRILAVIVLIVLAVVDALAAFIPIVAIAGIVIILFKPRGFHKFINNIYI